MSHYKVQISKDSLCSKCILHNFIRDLLEIIILSNKQISGELLVSFLKQYLSPLLPDIRVYVLTTPAKHDIYNNNFTIKIHSNFHSSFAFRLIYNKISSLETISAKKVALFIRNQQKLKLLSSELCLPKVIQNIIQNVLFE